MNLPRDRRRSGAQAGYSLAELAIALSIAGVMGSLLISIWTFANGFTRRGGVEVEAQQFGRIALTTLVRELREALAGPGAVTVWSTTAGAPVDAIGFLSAREEGGGRSFDIDQAANPSWRTAVYYVFDRSSGRLRRVTEPWNGALIVPSGAAGRLVAPGVRDVHFDRQGNLITIRLRMAAGRREITLETSVLPRN